MIYFSKSLLVKLKHLDLNYFFDNNYYFNKLKKMYIYKYLTDIEITYELGKGMSKSMYLGYSFSCEDFKYSSSFPVGINFNEIEIHDLNALVDLLINNILPILKDKDEYFKRRDESKELADKLENELKNDIINTTKRGKT